MMTMPMRHYYCWHYDCWIVMTCRAGCDRHNRPYCAETYRSYHHVVDCNVTECFCDHAERSSSCDHGLCTDQTNTCFRCRTLFELCRRDLELNRLAYIPPAFGPRVIGHGSTVKREKHKVLFRKFWS